MTAPSAALAADRSVPTLAETRRRLLQMHADTGLGHVGGNLSCLDTLYTLHHGVMAADDVFVLSKGHAAGALYAVLWSTGQLSDADLHSWCADGTGLPGHPVAGVPGVRFSTGSLGHGLSLTLGMAMARSWRQQPGHFFCLTSDGEWQEGSTWEALMLAAHRQPANVTVIVDVNGWQGFGPTDATLSAHELPSRIRAFGVRTVEVDGHQPSALGEALREAAAGGFAVVCAQTVKGRGTTLADTLESHYLPLPAADHPQAAPPTGPASALGTEAAP